MLQGDHSTKIEGVVRCLLQIHAAEQNSKSLVFSTVCAYKLTTFPRGVGTSHFAGYKAQSRAVWEKKMMFMGSKDIIVWT